MKAVPGLFLRKGDFPIQTFEWVHRSYVSITEKSRCGEQYNRKDTLGKERESKRVPEISSIRILLVLRNLKYNFDICTIFLYIVYFFSKMERCF